MVENPPPRSRQLVVSLIVACAMFMQNLNCKAITHAGLGSDLGWLSPAREPRPSG
jgi:hypothetical protein